jgi:hypothetical protein
LTQSTSDLLAKKMASDGKKYTSGHYLLVLVSAGETGVIKELRGKASDVVKEIPKAQGVGTALVTSGDEKMAAFVQYLVT